MCMLISRITGSLQHLWSKLAKGDISRCTIRPKKVLETLNMGGKSMLKMLRMKLISQEPSKYRLYVVLLKRKMLRITVGKLFTS
ncbi:unnamed protein product [Linum tenue]|uniref:Uncharacterized protein n=1 Tax=Linum tenue TaxID=586396 RepID=A0AAV0PYM3_9ROSI|nr:unnamed protein product [Linum tenue]